MKTIVKQAREVGTSAGVLLPREWLNKQVVVTLFSPSKEEIAMDVLNILFKNNLNEEAKGIYLIGSYARGDYTFDSDIDILVLTKEKNKLINIGRYEIMLISEQNFSKDLSNSLYYTGMLREAKPIINKYLIERYSQNKIILKTKRILDEIGKIVKINKETAGLCKKNMKVPDGVVYSIVLRLRELYLIKCLLSNKLYNRRDFIKIIGDEIYSAYSRIKRDEKEINNTSPDDIMNLIDLSEKWLKELKE